MPIKKPTKAPMARARAAAKKGKQLKKAGAKRSYKIQKSTSTVAGAATAKLGAYQIAAGRVKKGKKTIAKAKKLYKK